MAAVSPELTAAPSSPEAPLSHRLARRASEYARLMRLDKPIGTWLLLWPALWALWVAGAGRPEPRVLIVFLLGVMVMRAAGCVINDFADRDIDPHVRRTRDRPLAARRVSPVEALVLFAVLGAIALFLVTRLNAYTIRLAVIGALLTVSYPFVKRVFPMPQLYLGISFGGWSVLMAFAAQTDALPRVCWLLYIAAVLWAAVYDTIYAMIDREDDLKLGVKSSAILFADAVRARACRPQHALRALVSGWSDRGGAAVRLAAMADPQARARRLPARLPQQPVRGTRGVRRHTSRVHLRCLNCRR